MKLTDEQKAKLFDAMQADGVDNWEGYQGENYQEAVKAEQPREGWSERFDKKFDKDGPDRSSDSIGRNAGCDDCYTSIRVRAEHKSFIAQERSIAARDAVEERVRMIREEIEGVQVPYEEGKRDDWYLAASKERNQILLIPSLRLPASDNDTTT